MVAAVGSFKRPEVINHVKTNMCTLVCSAWGTVWTVWIGSLILPAREEKDPGHKRNCAKHPWRHSEEVARSTQDDLCPWDFPETHGNSRNEQNSPHVLLREVDPHQAYAGVLWRDIWQMQMQMPKNEWSSLWFCPVAKRRNHHLQEAAGVHYFPCSFFSA